jgi:hypothetical protein
VGFYFSSALGYASAAYEVVDKDTKSYFTGHFVTMFERARDRGGILLHIPTHRNKAELNETLLNDLTNALNNLLGEDECSRLIKGDHLLNL